MRFLKLDLMAVGPFTKVSIDLSRGQFGLHMIYGPNEAGKSSSLRAITDFLYGFPSRTKDDFVHPYAKLRIGGTILHSDGTELRCIRKKGTQNTLRDATDTSSIPDSALQKFIGDLDRNVFSKMFGIDHDALRQGGHEIVDGGGQVGETLFSSASGLSNLRSVHEQLNSTIHALFKPHGPSGELGKNIKAYDATKDKRKQSLVSAETWTGHQDSMRKASQKKEQLGQEVVAMQTDQNRLKRILDSLPSIAEWRKAKQELDAIKSSPILADDFAQVCNKLVLELRKYEQQFGSSKSELKSIDDQLNALPSPNPILDGADRIEILKVRLGEFRKAQVDKPRNEGYCQQHERTAREILRNMGRPTEFSNLEHLRLPSDKQARIQHLGNQKEGLVERVKSRDNALTILQRDIQLTKDRLETTTVAAHGSTLRSKLQQVQSEGNLESLVVKLRHELAAMELAVVRKLTELAPWTMTLENLDPVSVPSLATVDRFEELWRDQDTKTKLLKSQFNDEDKKAAVLDRELAILELNQSIPTLAELESKKGSRDDGWKLVRRAWLDNDMAADAISEFVSQFDHTDHLAGAYEQSVREVDQTAELLRTDAERVANKARIAFEFEQHAQKIEHLQAENLLLDREREELTQDWRSKWQSLAIEPLSPREMREWVTLFKEVRTEKGILQTKTVELQQLNERVATLRTELGQLLSCDQAAAEKSGLSLIALVQQAISIDAQNRTAESDQKQLSASLASDQAQLIVAQTELDQARSEMSQWNQDWASEMERIGLEHAALPSQANMVLGQITQLFQELYDADGFRKRNQGIERDSSNFLSDVQAILEEYSPERVSLPVEESIKDLSARIQLARENATTFDRLAADKKKCEASLRKTGVDINRQKVQLNELLRQAHCEDYDQLARAAELSTSHKRAIERMELLEGKIRSIAGVTTLDSFVAEADLESGNSDSLQPKIELMSSEIERVKATRDDAITQIAQENEALRVLSGQDEAGNLSSECESLASAIDEQFRELAVLRTCSAVLAAGIERYRERNQDPVLLSASKHFRLMTLGTFSGLRVDLDDQGKTIIVGTRSNTNEDLRVTQMSDGTCDQLYLALRLASLETWLEHHEPIPFVVDDILLNFDDSRALATLSALIELSSRTQVIFFTHHQHLVDLAVKSIDPERLFVHSVPQC